MEGMPPRVEGNMGIPSEQMNKIPNPEGSMMTPKELSELDFSMGIPSEELVLPNPDNNNLMSRNEIDNMIQDEQLAQFAKEKQKREESEDKNNIMKLLKSTDAHTLQVTLETVVKKAAQLIKDRGFQPAEDPELLQIIQNKLEARKINDEIVNHCDLSEMLREQVTNEVLAVIQEIKTEAIAAAKTASSEGIEAPAEEKAA